MHDPIMFLCVCIYMHVLWVCECVYVCALLGVLEWVSEVIREAIPASCSIGQLHLTLFQCSSLAWDKLICNNINQTWHKVFLLFNCPTCLLPRPSPTHTARDYYVEVWYKYGPMVERDGKLYCSDNSPQPFNSTDDCLDPLLVHGCPSQQCPFEAFIKWVLLLVTCSAHVLVLYTPCFMR